MEQAGWEFCERACNLMQEACKKNRERLVAAAEFMSARLLAGGRLFTFGCGHSGLVAQDVYYRAGGLMDLNCLFAPAVSLNVEPPEESSAAERRLDWVEGAAPAGGWNEKDVLIVISTSGVNVGPVELALRAKAKGVLLIALTSEALSQGLPARHQSAKRLCDLADVVLDNLVPAGDALIELAENLRMGSVSTVVGALLLQSLMIELHSRCAARGLKLPVYVSGNSPGGLAENERRKRDSGPG